MDTIYALSSGSPPAAIGIVRISGNAAGEALRNLSGSLPPPRIATLRTLRSSIGEVLDTALILWFPRPATATGEDLAELHCHGGRAVIAAVERELAALPGLRRAEPGEFTRRAFINGRMDLSETEGLADLLAAETELQRRSAQALSQGALSQQVDEWRERLLILSARVESVLDFGDEDDVSELPTSFGSEVEALRSEIEHWLARPRAEKLRQGVRVVLTGPPNSGKSTLFNALLEEAAAITSAEAGTTRDAIERSVSLGGVPIVLVDTAGLRGEGAGEIESIGIDRARDQIGRADVVLWLGEEGAGPPGSIEIETKTDIGENDRKVAPDVRVSALTSQGLDEVRELIMRVASSVLPKPGDVALNERQAGLLRDGASGLSNVSEHMDPLIVGEALRECRVAFDRLTGKSSTEDMLDALFGRFCIGK
ncbi:tRNA uridine-5-carboxymethylaminomethyl(34) synthesis GTPase MnmE [Qipengyuania atrilutea]|uniref:tRNA modification GTPase MnmE n=1 Tax=Qipengyuania atrilutea TaxID=2744473 RepID=A0A850H194_9SPHN|nr:tRNA uridine-5-carboxymethylaminomethyl(34) synthesis GTPase MnmE [Actirhodobacter atriluteus]NVD44456.1 tRNA uridine-5-carboxymethylaminomethyl(34) synthesis GTPase MnmE [Actirhodobacter atriluteus]